MAYKPKTVAHDADVAAFLATVEPSVRREDARALCDLMSKVCGQPPRMWGRNIVGFGIRRYRYTDGTIGEMLRMGFLPAKGALNLYIHRHFDGAEALMARLGKHSTGVSCTYVTRLANIDLSVLEALLRAGWDEPDAVN